MKKNLFFALIFFLTIFLNVSAAGKPPVKSWTVKNPFEQKNFVENVGQLDLSKEFPEHKIFYSAYTEGTHYYFTNKGIITLNYVHVKHTERQIEKIIDQLRIKEEKSSKGDKSGEGKEFGGHLEQQFSSIEFENANYSAEVIKGEKVTNYYSYSNTADKTGKTSFTAYAYKTLTYKNIYPNIDLVYEFLDDKSGFKYSFVLNPGANAKDIKMNFTGKTQIEKDAAGNLWARLKTNSFIHHTPETFIKGTKKHLASSYEINGKTVSFNVENYSPGQTVVIDPWTQNPNYTTGLNKGNDVDYDKQGNVYVYGGAFPFTMMKYSAGGALIWTYVTPFVMQFGEIFYGDFAIDRKSGSIYIIEGINAAGSQVVKLNPNATLMATFPGNSIFPEMFRISFSSCTNKAVIAGGGFNANSAQNCLLDTNLIGITPKAFVQGASTDYHDINCLALDDYGNCYELTNTSLLYAGVYDNVLVKLPIANLTAQTYTVSDGYAFKEIYSISYLYSLAPPDWPNGYNGLSVSTTNVYSYDSYVLKKWAGATGALTVNKPVNTPTNNTVVYWGGITSDDCNNVWIGSKKQVIQFDSSLNQVGTFNMPDTIYDVKIGSNNVLYTCGNAFVGAQQLTINPCNSFTSTVAFTNGSCLTTGSATVTPVGGVAPYTYSWSTTPVQTTAIATNLPAGTFTVTVTDNSCNPKTLTNTVTITASGAAQLTSTVTNVSCNGGSNGTITTSSTSTTVPTYTWSTGSNAASVNGLSAGVYTLVVNDNGCTANLTFTVTQPTAITSTVTAGVLKCFGDTTSISVAISGGTPSGTAPTYTVAWSNPNATGNVVHGLGIGNYGGIATDSKGCVVVFNTNLAQPAQILPTFIFTTACLGTALQFTDQSTGGPFTAYSWNFGDGSGLTTTQNPSYTYLAAGTYTVTLTVTTANGCTGSIPKVLTVDVPPQAAFVGDTLKGCPIHEVDFTDNSTCTAGTINTWIWSFGNGQSYVGQFPPSVFYDNTSPTVSANYSVTLTVVSTNGCSSSVVKNNYITVYPHPLPGFSFDAVDGGVLDVLNNNVQFYDHSQGASSVFWNFGDNFLSSTNSNFSTLNNPKHQYENTEPYTYYVHQYVSNIWGCKDSIVEPVVIRPAFAFYIPNSFSPNGDGVNEGFKGTGFGIDNTTYHLIIFDRWGNKIFTANDMEKNWDGRINGKGDVVMEDTYVWKVNFRDNNGLKHEYHGIVSVIK